MSAEKDEVQKWLDKGNKIKILPYYKPKNTKIFFGRLSSKAKKRNVVKGLMK